MRILIVLFYQTLAFISPNNPKIPSAEVQIKATELAIPAEKRTGAMIYGYDTNGDLIILRKGTNEFVCLADNPAETGFSAPCYHKDLEPYMKRGRDLKKEGKGHKEIVDIREADVKSGKLIMPKQGATLFVYFTEEDNYNKETGEVKNGNFRYVTYIPYATSESTGLPLSPEAPGMPWIMYPGLHNAHIMITPPTKQ